MLPRIAPKRPGIFTFPRAALDIFVGYDRATDINVHKR